MKAQFIPLDYQVFDFEGKNYVELIGRTAKGKRICVIDSYEPNFWAILQDGVGERKIKEIRKKIEEIKIKSAFRITEVLKTELHDKKFLGKKVKAIKVFITNHKDGHAVAGEMGFKEIDKRREYDVPLISKYIKEKKIEPLNWYEVSGDILAREDFGGISEVLEVDICIKADRIVKSKKQPGFKPRLLAFDIETEKFEIGKGDILMISLYGKNFRKVLTWKPCPMKQNYVECFGSEGEMLEKFVEYVKSYDPDLLVGYFSDGFDLPYLRTAAGKNKLKLALGLDGKQPTFSRGRILKGKIFGIVHVDLFRFIKIVYSQYMQSETLSLNDVAEELIGEKKGHFDFSKLKNMGEKDWKDFFAYNLRDSILTYKLAEKAWPDMIEFSKIMKEPLFNIIRNGMSTHVQNYILHNLERFNEIAEKRPLHDEIIKRRNKGKYAGAFVLQPKPGLYENIVMLDFTSSYASVTVTFNLSPSTLLPKHKKNSLKVETSEGTLYFSKEKGFFPLMLAEIIEKRKKYKKDYKDNPTALLKARSNAYKLLANASYGYQGFFGARYYCREAAAATAAIARKSILETIEKIKKEDYEVIYADTDGVTLLLGKKNKHDVKKLLKKLNDELPGIMKLELEDFYKRALFVAKRTTTAGAKKKYALLSESGKIRIRGFETVRRDWCALARTVQNEIIRDVLKKGNCEDALDYLKKIIQKLKNGEVEKEKLLIKTQLKKPIIEYKAISPHVTAAKKMVELGIPVDPGMLIGYYVAETKGKKGKKLIREKVKLPEEKGKYDFQYYINHQILPSVENIFEVFNINLKEIVDGKKQTSLKEF